MKKCFVFLLLLITTTCTFVPCCGFDECCADQFANTTGHDKPQKEGACSPFFACATCPGFVQLTKPVYLADPIIEKTIHHQAILKIDLPTYSCSFWQPPRSC